MNQTYNHKIDIWALSCVFYYLAVHVPPFYGENLLSLGNDICRGIPKIGIKYYSERIEKIIMGMMVKD
jgi:serine/threonine protein kinase